MAPCTCGVPSGVPTDWLCVSVSRYSSASSCCSPPGFGLTRGIPFIELRDPALRSVAYWAHVATPVLIGWLFVLHRLAGRRIRWSAGLGIGALSIVVGILCLWIAEPREADVDAEADFQPALARTSTGGHIVAAELMRDDECARCHPDAHAQWQYSAHRFASFNNPAYLFSVRNTRESVLARDGNVHAARFCAGCHDPVPLISGRFDDPDFDDVHDPAAHAGITCVSCHAIEAIGSVRGNADYVIGVPERYPFSRSDHAVASWLNGFLIKAKPALHKRTFLKPLHQTAEFCGTCHKVHLPVALNNYRWLRGQNHYDAFLLSGVSGHGVSSFYYPPEAEQNCNRCHMPLVESEDFAAKRNDASGALTVHDHLFPAANTALAHLLGLPDVVNEAHREFLEGSLRVDIFGIRAGAAIDAPLTAPLRPDVPTLAPGQEYVIEVVLRTLTLGHTFTQGTADSNEVWLEVTAVEGDEVIGISGGLNPDDQSVDPYAHFVNAYVLDRDGNRIDRRNAEDIFTPLYNHQIPPGAASVAHYRLTVPEDLDGPLVVTARLRYRKFDTIYMRHFQGEAFAGNTLPITTIASDTVAFPVRLASGQSTPDIPVWQRWNDYGIGLLAKPDSGALRQAEAAFQEVGKLGRAEGDLNLARVLIREGRLDEAGEALRRAAAKGAGPLVGCLVRRAGRPSERRVRRRHRRAHGIGRNPLRGGPAARFRLLQGLPAVEHARTGPVRTREIVHIRRTRTPMARSCRRPLPPSPGHRPRERDGALRNGAGGGTARRRSHGSRPPTTARHLPARRQRQGPGDRRRTASRPGREPCRRSGGRLRLAAPRRVRALRRDASGPDAIRRRT